MIDSLWRTSYLLKGTRICKKTNNYRSCYGLFNCWYFCFAKRISVYTFHHQVRKYMLVEYFSLLLLVVFLLILSCTVSDDTACLWRGGAISCRLINIFLVLWGTNYLVCLFSALFQNRTVVACLLSLKRLSLNIVVRTNVWSEHYEASVWRILNF